MESFEKFRQSCILYIKADLAILAALATLVTVFRIEVKELPNFFGETEIFIIIIISLLIFGTILERWLLFRSIAHNDTPEKKDFILARRMLIIQTVLHILLISGAWAYTSGRVHVRLEYTEQENLYSYLKGEVSRFLNDNHRLPKSANELTQQYDDVDKYLKRFVTIPFSYVLRDSVNYSIVLPGFDKILGTDDDRKHDVVIVYRSK
jgi:hypothetical protein